jgi:hypothetical protein
MHALPNTKPQTQILDPQEVEEVEGLRGWAELSQPKAQTP